MKEYRSIALAVIAIFFILLLGAYYSPTFNEQKTYLELFFLFGSLLFIFSALVVFAAIGFSSFALYLSLFLTVIMLMHGIEGALIVTLLTYFSWGAIFSMEVLLLYHGVKSAKEWFIERYDFISFKREYYVFYPMLMLAFFFLEVIPSMLYRESFLKFSPSKLLDVMEEMLK